LWCSGEEEGKEAGRRVLDFCRGEGGNPVERGKSLRSSFPFKNDRAATFPRGMEKGGRKRKKTLRLEGVAGRGGKKRKGRGLTAYTCDREKKGRASADGIGAKKEKRQLRTVVWHEAKEKREGNRKRRN